MPVLPGDPNHPGHYGFDYWLSTTNFYDMDPLMGRNGEIVYIEGESSEIIVKDALEFMKRENGSPFFAVIWYGSPHHPFQAPEALVKPYKDLGLDEQLAHHLAEIAGIDHSMGTLRQGLRDLGIAENTLLWYCSDNGGLPEDPHSGGVLKGNKGSLWEGGIRVPGIIEWPGTIQPQISDFPASTMDMMPTLVDLLGLPEDSMLGVVDGMSIVPLLKGTTPVRDGAIAFGNGDALIDGNYKLVTETGGKKGPVATQLFDLAADPGETTDISGQHAERVARMREAAQAVSASVKNSAAGKDYPGGLIHPKRPGQPWASMPEYQQLFSTFNKLKPGWNDKKRDGKIEE
ncbi:MAG: sulfatase-like hydrolase/transferase [Bdellovibrionaceae bacterium]|nr:sulfatase-like hydrolase/transferase [Pseudobdellovibrionaceae bacterium]